MRAAGESSACHPAADAAATRSPAAVARPLRAIATWSAEPAAGDGSVTSLGNLESNAQLPDRFHYANLRHARWHTLRDRTKAMLDRLATSPKVIQRFEGCGGQAFVYQHLSAPHLLKIHCDKCRHRLCQPCQLERSMIIRHNLERLAETAGHRLKMLTLTLKHTDRPLRAQIDHLVGSFREFRRLRIWKDAVKGAAWVLEVKVGEDGKWHPHIHCLLDGKYMGQGWLGQAWLACTGTSNNVDIRAMSASNGAKYISKYVAKPASETVLMSDALYEEYALAMKGRRGCAALHAWRKCPLAERADDETLLGVDIPMGPENWTCLGHFDTIALNALQGDAYARSTLRLLLDGSPGRSAKDPPPHPPPMPFALLPDDGTQRTLF